MTIFRRKIYDSMLAWKEGSDGRSALLIEGARRVGKTTVVKEFAKREYDSYLLIDFSKADDETKSYFKKHSEDFDTLFRLLQLKYRVSLHKRRSVVIFDEVQSFPRARELIKHFVEDRRYDYIETGSLISLRKNVKDIVIPSEEKRISLHPMDFEEFLWAQGDDVTVGMLREFYDSRTPLGESMHRNIMEKYATYMLVGGMPQAVDALVESNDFSVVESVKEGILNLYSEDSEKIGDGRSDNAKAILMNLPGLLSKHDKKFSPSAVKKNSRTRDYLRAVTGLSESKMVNVCYRSTDPNPAMRLCIDDTSFKIYLLDTGLLFTSAFRSNTGSRDRIYESILKNKMGINKGMFFENMVSQELTARDVDLVFSRFTVKDSTNAQEVDFLIARDKEVIPLEVKSGTSTKHKSLDRFMVKYDKWAKRAYVIHSKDLRVDGDITYLPIYMTMFLRCSLEGEGRRSSPYCSIQ